MTDLHHKRGLIINWTLVFVMVGVLVRLGLWLRVSQDPLLLIQGDGRGYEQIARNMIEGNGFSTDSAPPYTPDMLRTPGYSLFISGIYLAVGYRPEIITLVQNILSLITLYIAYRLTVYLFGFKAAGAAAALMALDIGLIILANVTLTETLFMILLLPATYCLFKGMDSSQRWIWMGGAGVLLGFATLVRPVALYVILLLLPFAWWALDRPWREKAVRATILLVTFVLTLAPWSYRNLRVFGSPNISGAQALTMKYHTMYLRSALNKTTLFTEEERFQEEIVHDFGEHVASPVELDNWYQTRALAEISQHPVQYVELYAKAVGLMLVLPNTNFLANILGILDHPTGIIADMRTRSLPANIQALMDFTSRFLSGSPDQLLFFIALIAEVFVVFLTYVLAVVGVSVGLRNQHKTTVALLLVIIGYFFAVTGPIGTGRYRLPAMPYLMMLAGYGFVQFRAWRQTRHRQEL